MITFPNCKINLGLNILRKREDGFHDLETAFFPVPLTDALEIIITEKKEIEFAVTGLPAGVNDNNLCIKAYHLLKKDSPKLPFIKMHLHKAIPLGAGLGGGSADAAFTLELLNKCFHLNLDKEKLLVYAVQLGSDCPFFIINKPCIATGRGEILELVNIDLSQYKILLINPGIHISTAWAFSNIIPSIPAISIKEIIKQPVETWKDDLKNDFETPVFNAYPEIKKIKETIYNMGAAYASLSGSGSTVVGLFKKNAEIVIPSYMQYFYKIIQPYKAD